MRRCLSLLGLALLMGAVSPAQSPAPSQDTASLLRFAASQHEIISILLEEGQYPEILVEFEKILELGLTGRNEKPVVQEAWLIVEALRKAGQYELAHQVVDGTLAGISLQENEFYLLMLRGKIYQDQGRTDEALEAYRSAQELNPEN